MVELSHGGVDERVAGSTGTPGLEGIFVVFPFDISVFGFEGLVHARGRDEQVWMEGGKETYQTNGQCASTCL